MRFDNDTRDAALCAFEECDAIDAIIRDAMNDPTCINEYRTRRSQLLHALWITSKNEMKHDYSH